MSTSTLPEVIWKAEIGRRIEQGDGLEFSLSQFARTVGADENDRALRTFVSALVEAGAVCRIEAYRCPITKCGRTLSVAGAPYAMCPFCFTDYQQEGVEAFSETFYRLAGETSRDIRWMIVIHGMNSRAQWQEEFSWQIANRLRYSAPVLIYKYGWATIDVLVRWIHRRLARRLGERIRIAIAQAEAGRRPSRPDIIAHSFGTRLLALLLEDPKFSDLQFGRIITAGSIIRPDFDWDRHIESGRVEAVLNHVGARDAAVPLAQFAIPGTGPGGKAGYAARRVVNVRDADFGHSDFFKPEKLRTQIANNGLWHDFLTHPLESFSPEGRFAPDSTWKTAPRLLRAMTRSLGYFIFLLAAPFSWLRRQIDP